MPTLRKASTERNDEMSLRPVMQKVLALRQQIEASQKREVMLRDALKEIRDDFDCDSDSHKYGTTCRSCLAREALAATEPKEQGK